MNQKKSNKFVPNPAIPNSNKLKLPFVRPAFMVDQLPGKQEIEIMQHCYADRGIPIAKSECKKKFLILPRNVYVTQGHENARTEVPTTSRTDVPKISDLNSLQNSFPAASLSTQAVKVAKIPRSQAISVNLKSQNFIKGSSELQNKAYKRKLPEKVCEESDPNFSRRKTYVVKDHNVLTVTRPCASVNSEHVSAVTENHENNKVSENLKSSPNLQLNRKHSQTDHAAVKSKSTTAKNSKIIEHTANFTSPKTNMRSGPSSKGILSGSNATVEIPGNLKSKIDNFIPTYIATKVAYSAAAQNTNTVGEISPIKTHGVFLESSESDCKGMTIEEFVDFSAMKPSLQTTKNKKRNFAFDVKKGKTVVEKKSQCEIVNSETGENGLQKSANACQSGAGAINDNEGNKINEADFTHIISEEVVNRNDLNNIPSDACAVRKKTTKGSRKIKDNQSTGTKKHSCFDDNAISKFEEINKTTKVNKVKGDEKEPQTYFLCEEIGINTLLVKAEIHLTPPSSESIEKFCCDLAQSIDHYDVVTVAVIDSGNVDLQSDPVSDIGAAVQEHRTKFQLLCDAASAARKVSKEQEAKEMQKKKDSVISNSGP